MADLEAPRKAPRFDSVFWLTWVLVSTLGWVLGWSFAGDVAIGASMGVLQYLVLRSRVRRASWWILFSAVGWIVGRVVVIILFSPESLLLPGLVLGGLLGVTQWLVLRQWVNRAGWWIMTSTLGWAVGPILGASLVGGVVGAVTGFTLELLLRHPR